MTNDVRRSSDAQLLEAVLEGRVGEDDPRVDELFQRRPQWRELLELSRNAPDARRAAPWDEPASEEERRFVAECLAEARAGSTVRAVAEARDTLDARNTPEVRRAPEGRGTSDVRSAPQVRSGPDERGIPDERDARAPKRWPRLLIALAALLLISWLARMWWLGERVPERGRGQLLGSDAAVDSFESKAAAPDFSWFEWKCKSPRSGETFELTIWAADSNRARGRQLSKETTSATDETSTIRVAISDAKRADWPPEVIWRVDRIDSLGMRTFGPDWHARRTMH
jgi:hypothetical protein